MNTRKFLISLLRDLLSGRPVDEARLLGGMEAGLLFAGYIQQGKPFAYKMVPDKRGFFGKEKTREETYKEHIIRLVGEYLATPSGWHTKDELPPLSRQTIEMSGPKDLGGHSRTLIFRHQSGKLSWGDAVIHEGKVVWWYPGHMDDLGHIPESKDSKDLIVSWALVPDVEQIAGLIY